MAAVRLYVCQTCERDGRPEGDGRTRGEHLADAIAAVLKTLGPTGGFVHLVRVPCLNGCPSPCNIALRGSRRYSMRFSRLAIDDAESVVQMSVAYANSETGDLPESQWPAAMQGKRTVHTPPPHLLFNQEQVP